jgi:DNA polymerase-1
VERTVHLVDAMAYIFRAFYANAESRSPAGAPTNASFGFLDFLLRLIARENPTHLGVVFDSGPKSFRNELYPDYKANRQETPPELLPQFEQCERLTAALGLPVLKHENHEADDVLATLAQRCREAGHRVTIFSGDKDLAQLVDEGLTVLDPARSRRLTPRTVKKRFGVEPAQMTDFFGLTGDASDNIPGVKGVGPKTATGLLQALTSLEGIYDGLEQVHELPLRGARTLGARLAEHREMAFLSRELATLKRDLPLEAEPDELECAGAVREACEALFAELGFDNFLPFVTKSR